MNFAELKAELVDRGFGQLSTTRQGRFINDARSELDRMYLWPYREKSVTGITPLTISDLDVPEVVVDITQADMTLRHVQFENLQRTYGDLSITGIPTYYYIGWPSGTPVLATYPVTTDTIGVQYWRTTPELTGTDTPLAPVDFHGIYVDIAEREATRDVGGDWERLQPGIDRKIDLMAKAIPPGQADGPMSYLRTYVSGNY